MSKFTTGKVKIPVINKAISRKLLLLLLLGGGLGAYMLLGKKPTAKEVQSVVRADKVLATVTPTQVRPNTFLNVSGTFTDASNKPVRTRQAMYYIWQKDTLEGMKLVSSGLVGNDIDRFQKTIPTTAFPVGQYLMLITDEGPLSMNEIGGLNAGPPPFGIGAGAIPPGGSTTLPGATGVTLG